jgi:hypothetical protein
MFDIWQMKRNIEMTFSHDLEHILKPTKIQLSPHVVQSISDFIMSCYVPSPKRDSSRIFQTPELPIGNLAYNFDILPAPTGTNWGRELLVARCLGDDDLYEALVSMIIHVQKHHNGTVFFFTTKWDMSIITGRNIQRIYDLYELQQQGINFCFILITTWGISLIPEIG